MTYLSSFLIFTAIGLLYFDTIVRITPESIRSNAKFEIEGLWNEEKLLNNFDFY